MDSFFGIGIGELFFIAIIALIVLGPERLPGAIRELSKWMRTIRNLSSELSSQFGEEMKAFDDINPTKILRELTEEPTDQINKATGAAKTPAKPAPKPAAKPATTTAKPAGAKPASSTTANTSANSSANTGAAKTTTGITSTKNITPPAPKKPAGDSAAKPEAEAAAQEEPEKRILPPAEPAAGQTGAGLETSEPPSTVEPPAAIQEDRAAGDKAEDKIVEDKIVEDKIVEDKIVMDAAPRPTLTVNGKATAAEGDA